MARTKKAPPPRGRGRPPLPEGQAGATITAYVPGALLRELERVEATGRGRSEVVCAALEREVCEPWRARARALAGVESAARALSDAIQTTGAPAGLCDPLTRLRKALDAAARALVQAQEGVRRG